MPGESSLEYYCTGLRRRGPRTLGPASSMSFATRRTHAAEGESVSALREKCTPPSWEAGHLAWRVRRAEFVQFRWPVLAGVHVEHGTSRTYRMVASIYPSHGKVIKVASAGEAPSSRDSREAAQTRGMTSHARSFQQNW